MSETVAQIPEFETFDDLRDYYNKEMRQIDWKPSKITTSGYGDKKFVGVASCGQDDGDVEVYAVRDTEENRSRVLASVNRAVRDVNEENASSSYPIEAGEFCSEYIQTKFDEFHFSATLWG